MGIFNAFAQADGPKDLSLEELYAKTRGDKQLLCMLTRPKAYTQTQPAAHWLTIYHPSSHHA